MISATQERFWTRPRVFALFASLSVAALFIGANAHLIAVSFLTKPDCVLQPNTEGAATYRAAKPSC